jgi:hypothetical protein
VYTFRYIFPERQAGSKSQALFLGSAWSVANPGESRRIPANRGLTLVRGRLKKALLIRHFSKH